MASAWTTSESASARRPAPSVRATAEEIPPPTAPADIICMSISTGKTSATPASASVPSRATKYVSMRPTDAWTNMTRTFGVASLSRVPTIRPSSSIRVRGPRFGRSPPRAATARGLLSAQRHARRGGSRHEGVPLVGDVTLEQAEALAGLHEPTRRAQLRLPHRLEEIDLQLDGREGLALGERAGVGDPHRGVGDVAQHAAVQGAHWVGVPAARLQLHDGLAGRDRAQREPDQGGDGGRR